MNPLVAPEAHARPHRTALSVNVNKIALLRNTRHIGIPDVVKLSRQALEAGAQGITVHPRPDARHIRTQDVHDLQALLLQWPEADYNIEGNPFHNLMGFVRELRPQQVTFVPDSEDQFTSDHGWRFPEDADRLQPLIDEARALGVRVSLFMDPLPDQMAAARATGAERVELYTEAYASAHGTPRQAAVLAQYTAAAQAAIAAGLEINAGHDLNRDNLTDFLRAVPGVLEVSIGHALLADALELGLTETIRDYQRCIQAAFTPVAR
jgi:pyridoxine 5-phosphate synthase